MAVQVCVSAYLRVCVLYLLIVTCVLSAGLPQDSQVHITDDDDLLLWSQCTDFHRVTTLHCHINTDVGCNDNKHS